MISKDYPQRVYAGWLGKIIGIRCGAPIEGWTYERIRNVYGELDGYPVSYKNFAADDDSNGPIFFIRSLEDCKSLSNFSSSDVAQALLNYAPFEHGFFWWGGYGISTEHTAYLNLRNGIPAPRSGSIRQNGAATAEQIGGQIFIDPWGLVAPGDPALAAKLAREAASVTHDGNAVYGGIFIACCISLAFVETEIDAILDRALTFIPKDCEYARVVNCVRAFHREHPENWRDCFAYLFENFGYDKYPGNCHIIPNAGAMILSLLYGEKDFDQTLNICNMCGWDTDCNVGNVGCIMGVLTGLEGINFQKWRAPINDFLACSGVVPSLNAMDIPYGASYFARQGYRLKGEELPKEWKAAFPENESLCHFEYPGSTHAIRGRCEGGNYHLRNTDEQARDGRRSLKITACQSPSGRESFFYKQTYYRPADFDDSRYDPSFSPLFYPGDTLHASVRLLPAENGMIPAVSLYAKNGVTGEIFRGSKATEVNCWHDLSLKIPGNQTGYLSEAGIILSGTAGGGASSDLTVYLDRLFFESAPDYRIDFSSAALERWGGLHDEIPQFTRLKGHTYLDGKYLSLSCSDFGELYTGLHTWKDVSASCTIKPLTGEEHFLNVRVQGAMRSYAGGLSAEGMLVLRKNHMGYTTLCKTPFPWEAEKEYALELRAQGNRLTLLVNGKEVLSYTDEKDPFLVGCVGVSVEKGSHCLYRDFQIKALN